MAKSKPKFYVVWVGQTPGIYTSWDQAKAHVQNFPDAKYKAFKSKEEAEAAFNLPWEEYYETGGSSGKSKSPKTKGNMDAHLHEIEANSIAVDAACSGNPGVMEYRGVQTLTGSEIFHSPVWPVGTNNIGEFLAIIHALALYHEKQPDLTIYTDSKIAMGWVKLGECRSKLKRDARTAKLWQVVRRGEKWLAENKWKNPIVKWDTVKWGEIPADFGRK